MRGLARLIVVLLLAVAGWQLAPMLTEFRDGLLPAGGGETWKLEMVPQAAITPTWIVERERWLAFPVATGASRIRILSNANVFDIAKAREARAADPRRRWRYALDIEVVDGNGHVLLRRRHHHRTDLADQRLTDGRVVTAAFYLNETLSPVSGVVVTLNLAGLPQAARLRIRAAHMDPDIADIGVRAYFPEQASAHQLDYLWQRLSERQKSSMAKGSVYAHELLTEPERLNLLHNQWQPAGPQGAAGVDFHGRELYVLRDVDSEPVDDPVPPAGLVAAPGRIAVIAMPEQGGEVEFDAVPLDAASDGTSGTPPSIPLRLTGHWYGPDSFSRQAVSLAPEPAAPGPASGVLRARQRFGGGQVELEATRPVALRAYMEIDGVRTEITPEKLYQRLFVADATLPVRYTVAHEGRSATPVRLEARYLQTAAGTTPAPTLRYEFIDANEAVLGQGEVALGVPPALPVSPYDEAPGAAPGSRVSDALELYFSVPAEATGLRLSAGRANPAATPVLVGLSTRPTRLARQIRAPEDRFDFAARDGRVPAWFAINPDGYARLIADNRSQYVAIQPRPPKDRPELLSGQFIREDFRPAGRWLARQLLVPREPGLPLREEALPSTFSPLAANRAQGFDFPRWMGLRQLAPTILWVAPDDTPFAATLRVDGREHHRFGGHGRYGEIRLPPLPAGSHELRIEFTAGGRQRPQLYINHVKPGTDAYALRLAARVDGEIAFDVERTGTEEQVLAARLFQPAGWRGRTQLHVRVEGPPPKAMVPLPGWLFDDRRYDVRPDPSWAAPVFDTRGERSDAGQPVQILLPAGTPAGRWRVVFRIEQGPPGYLALSRMTPGVETRRRLFEEAEVRHVAVE